MLAGLAISLGFGCPMAQASGKSDTGTVSAAKQIDALLAKDWQANKLQPNAPVSDETFVRRIYLDVAGRITTYREAETFLNSKDPDKRRKLIDELLASDGYVQHFFNYWSDILRLQTDGRQAGAVTGSAYARYLKESLGSNKPYDQIVRELVASQGNAWDNGAIGYYMRDRGMPLDNMANTVRIFLGTRIECAQCHNHPFDKWTQMEFYQMAAYTYGIETNDYSGGPLGEVRDLLQKQENEMLAPLRAKRKKGEENREAYQEAVSEMRQVKRDIGQTLNDIRNSMRYTAVGFRDRKQVTLPHDYPYDDAKPKSKVTAATMMGHEVAPKPGQEGLEAYAAWMTARDNPRFTTVVANRLWKKVFGLGLIEPVDELMDSTVATNPELMKYLEGLMVSVDYDMKQYLRVLLNTETYQRSVSTEEVIPGVPYHFTGPVLRRMTAEQMWDSFVTLINPTPDMQSHAQQELAAKRIDGAKFMYEALDEFGAEAILAGAEKSVGIYKAQSDKVKSLQAELVKAREAKDQDQVKKISRELSELNRRTRETVRKNVMEPASAKYVSLKKDSVTAMSGAMEGEGDAAMMMMSESKGKMIPGFDRVRASKKDALTPEREAQLEEEANYYGIKDRRDVRQYIKARLQNERTWLRSAEIGSPAPRGHYLREFGQSDREIIENANHEASVSQALVMMNSQLLPQVMDRHSASMLSLNKKEYHDDKVTTAYMTLLSRPPTDKERDIWRKAADRGLTEIEDLLYALINTQQFIFIQ